MGFNQPLLAVCPWVSHFASLGLHFPTGKLDYLRVALTFFRGSPRPECSLHKDSKKPCDWAGPPPGLYCLLRKSNCYPATSEGSLEGEASEMGTWQLGGWLSPWAWPLLQPSSSGSLLLSPEGRRGSLGWGKPGPPLPALFAQTELPDGEGQGPSGPRRPRSGWAGGSSFDRPSQAAQQRHPQSVSSSCSCPTLSHPQATH